MVSGNFISSEKELNVSIPTVVLSRKILRSFTSVIAYVTLTSTLPDEFEFLISEITWKDCPCRNVSPSTTDTEIASDTLDSEMTVATYNNEKRKYATNTGVQIFPNLLVHPWCNPIFTLQ